MPEQLALTGFDAQPQLTDRLFFALFPDAATAERMAGRALALRAEHGLRGQPLHTERLHVTLHHLGDYAGLPRGVTGMAREAAAMVKAEPFELRFDRVLSFKRASKLPFVLRGDEGLAAVTQFQQQLGAAMKRVGLGKWVQAAYTPHVTLLYDDHAVAGQATDPIAWTAQEFVLVHSLIGKTVHLPLARWPLLN